MCRGIHDHTRIGDVDQLAHGRGIAEINRADLAVDPDKTPQV